MSGALFHHARDLAYVRFGVVHQTPRSELLAPPDCSRGCDRDDDFHSALWFDAAYRWAAERLGFWPVFLAVGGDDEDRRMTGYQDQWRRWRATEGEEQRPPSRVLFSWRKHPPGIVFMDFAAWHIVLNLVEFPAKEAHGRSLRPLSEWEERQLWKRSWRAADWVRRARTTAVQAVVPTLDLRTADELWCRNQADRKHLVDLGFAPGTVSVKRLRRRARTAAARAEQ